MSNHRDPTRICTRRMKLEDLCARVKLLTASPLPEPFRFGLECLSRRHKAPMVCSDCFSLPIAFCFHLTSFLTFFFSQHFLQSNVMEHGQKAGVYAPDRTEDDPSDVEYVGNFGSSDSADEE